MFVLHFLTGACATAAFYEFSLDNPKLATVLASVAAVGLLTSIWF